MLKIIAKKTAAACLRHWKILMATVLLSIAGYLVIRTLPGNDVSKALTEWLNESNDPELLRLYQNTKDNLERTALGVVLRSYEKKFGKGAWTSHFKDDTRTSSEVCYREIVKIAMSLSNVKEREAFLAAHADAYDALIQAKEFETARKYSSLLQDLKAKGGRDWRLISDNPFSLAVYDQLKGNLELWNWYAENAQWCDKFLITSSPGDDTTLSDLVNELRVNRRLYQSFSKDVAALSDDERHDLADAEDDEGSLYAPGLVFIRMYSEVLYPLEAAGASMIDSMAVIANNIDAFDFKTNSGRREAGIELAKKFYKFHKVLWENAADDSGAHVIWLSKQIPLQWADEIIGKYGRYHIATFLHDNYNDSDDRRLISAAAETVYRCEEPGWAVLQRYRESDLFKKFLVDKRIGYRTVPFILKFGEERAFAELEQDPRWVDEYFDKDGKLKRKDVSWYEMSPVGGDLATVLKKWSQGRPCSMGEIGWAIFDTADMIAMAFTLGASKVATTAGKAGGKVAVKSAAKSAGRSAAKTGGEAAAKHASRTAGKRVGQQTIKRVLRSELVNAERHLGSVASGKMRSKGWTVFKRMAKIVNEKIHKGAKVAAKVVKRTWQGVKDIKPETWAKAHKASKALMWIKFAIHTVPEKGPDFVSSVGEDAGKLVGDFANAITRAGGEFVRNAVQEALTGGPRQSFSSKVITWIIIAFLFLISFHLLMASYRPHHVT